MTSGRGGVPADLLIDRNTAIPVGDSTYYIEVGTHPR